MATEKQMDELISAVNEISEQLGDRSRFDWDDIQTITTSLFRIAEALDRMNPPPPKPPLTPANNYWARKRWEEENGRPWTDKESID